MEILQRGRDQMADQIAEDILDQGEDLLDNPFTFNDFLESQGTRLHFLSVVLSHLELLAEAQDERLAAMPRPKPPKAAAAKPRKRAPRTKKLPQNTSADTPTEDI